MKDDSNLDKDQREIRPDDHFEGSRPGKGTALVVVTALAGVALYNFWPSIALALHFS